MKKRCELLAPCGDIETLKVAVLSGADAVYLAGKRFGARASATNFDNSELIEAVKFSHLYGVKIYVTVNTLIHEDELDSVLDYVKFLYKIQVDALIIQDIGLISLIKNTLPDFEIHASTQMHSTNSNSFKELKRLGVKRVVVAREMSIDEIDSIDTDLEIEAFIHGALCISYSGECLFSSLLMNRSGNRGECAQICRLPFNLLENGVKIDTNGNYLLSTKELNTSKYFKRIMESNIYSLKIEGRLKSPSYVGCVTRLYRDLIDQYNDGVEDLIVDKELINDLAVIFNREYTSGFLFNATNEELMNIKTPNHLGIKLGKITKFDNNYIYIKLDREVFQGDAIRINEINEGMYLNYIYDINKKLINHASTGDTILIDKKYKVDIGNTVNLTQSTYISNKYINNLKRTINVDMIFKGYTKELMELTITDGENEIMVHGNIVDKAINRPITKDDIKNQLSKLGNTPFKLNNISIEINDDAFINLKDLNELRRSTVSILSETREKKIVNKSEFINNKSELVNKDISGISVSCYTKEQVDTCIEKDIDRIYISDIKLYNLYKDNNKVYFRTNRIGKNIIKTNNNLVTTLSDISLGGIGDYYLNVTNHETINYLSKYLDLITLSIELNDNNIENIMNYYNNNAPIEIVLYQYPEVMLTKYCPLNLLVNKDKICHVCSNNNIYELEDRNNKRYRIISEVNNHLTHILYYKPIDKIDNVSFYKNIGIKNYRIELLDEDSSTLSNLIDNLRSNL